MNNFISDFQIVGTSVKNLNIKNDYVSLPNNNSVKRKIDISHIIKPIEVSDKDNTLTGIVLLSITVIVSGEKKKYKFDMTIEGCFTASTTMGEERFAQMLNVNGITSLYSIARSFAHSVSSQTLAEGNILLPMINVVNYSKNRTEGTEEK